MSADFCSVTLLWHNDDLPQWDKAEKLIRDGKATITDHYYDVDIESLVKDLHNLKEVVEGDRRDIDRHFLMGRLKGWNIIVTGGMTWCDSPTEAFDIITRCDNISVHDPDLGCYIPLMRFLKFV